MIRLFDTYIAPTAADEVAKVLASGRLSAGQEAERFEIELCTKFNWKFCSTVNSGTSALHLALASLEIGEGDEVIIPSQTFIATGLSVLYTGAKVVFSDVKLENANICVESIKQNITDRTKAIIIVHWGGEPCELSEIREICDQNGIYLIDDCAHAIGSQFKGAYIGNNSADISCFSFQAIKHITCGDGGAVVTQNPKLAEIISDKRWFGISRKNDLPGLDGERNYNLNKIGYKYHLSDFNAVLGRQNLINFEKRLLQRQVIADIYRRELSGLKGLETLTHSLENKSAYWLFAMKIDRRDQFMKAMASRGIETSIVHRGINGNDIFNSTSILPNQRILNKTLVHIPMHDQLSDNDILTVVNAIKKGW